MPRLRISTYTLPGLWNRGEHSVRCERPDYRAAAIDIPAHTCAAVMRFGGRIETVPDIAGVVAWRNGKKIGRTINTA